MNNKTFKLASTFLLPLFALVFALLPEATQAQKPSPADSAVGKIGAASVKIKYNSPSVRGRKIWGDLVPYDKAWRLGANEATTIETDKPIKIEGKELPAGNYTVFASPGEKEWQFVFNSQVGQWGIKRTGEANYDPANNVLTVNAKPKKSSEMNERMKFDVAKNKVTMKWENLEVPLSVR